MVYDAFILSLTILGIASVVVFSYKIAHSRLYPVGIVRKLPGSRKPIDEAAAQLGGLVDVPPEQIAAAAPIRVEPAPGKEMWRCEKCGLLQYRGKDFQCRRCDPMATQGGHFALEKEIAEHGEALKLQRKLVKDLEKRIRQLEVELVKKSQEAAGDKPRLPRAEYVN